MYQRHILLCSSSNHLSYGRELRRVQVRLQSSPNIALNRGRPAYVKRGLANFFGIRNPRREQRYPVAVANSTPGIGALLQLLAKNGPFHVFLDHRRALNSFVLTDHGSHAANAQRVHCLPRDFAVAIERGQVRLRQPSCPFRLARRADPKAQESAVVVVFFVLLILDECCSDVPRSDHRDAAGRRIPRWRMQHEEFALTSRRLTIPVPLAIRQPERELVRALLLGRFPEPIDRRARDQMQREHGSHPDARPVRVLSEFPVHRRPALLQYVWAHKLDHLRCVPEDDGHLRRVLAPPGLQDGSSEAHRHQRRRVVQIPVPVPVPAPFPLGWRRRRDDHDHDLGRAPLQYVLPEHRRVRPQPLNPVRLGRAQSRLLRGAAGARPEREDGPSHGGSFGRTHDGGSRGDRCGGTAAAGIFGGGGRGRRVAGGLSR
mmetsp:Transcript_5104/g.14684  ORF Transcript_5104/g.14684 Transcript_5104/m.14684 type:complete len:430 (-) Transcript_5104:689-1978(-)